MEKSEGHFNGEEMELERRRTSTLIWLDNRPSSIQYKRALYLLIPWIILPFVWYWIGVYFYDLPKLALAILGFFYWAYMAGVFMASVLFPLVSRQSVLQLRSDGIWYHSGPAHLSQMRVTWEEIANMEFISFAGIKMIITKNTGERWIRGLDKKTFELIKHIVENEWHENLEAHVKDIVNASSSVGFTSLSVDSKNYYKRWISPDWTDMKFREIKYIYLGGFALLFPFGILVALAKDSFIPSWLGYIFVALSLMLIVAIKVDLSGTYAIALRPGEEVFVKTKKAFEDSLNELGIEYKSYEYGKVSEHYTLKIGGGYFSNIHSVVSDMGNGGRISIYCPSKKNKEILHEIMRVTDKYLDRADLKKPHQIILG